MDVIIAHPFLHQKGGVERVVLEIAKKFNPVIYTMVYDKEKTFEEFKDFEIRRLPKTLYEKPFFFLKWDERRYNAVGAGFRYFDYKFKRDYDVINAHGTPAEWIRNKNERVCWFVHSPNREAFDLYNWRMKRLPIWKRPINWALIQAYKFAEFRTVPRIEKLCTNSEVTEERIRKYLKRDDAEVINPGVNPEEYFCRSYDKFFFYPSRIVPEKRFEIVIEAFKKFYKESKDKNWKLIIAGYLHGKPAEEYFENLKMLGKDYPIEFRVNVKEHELKELYSKCYLTLFSAINEDWGLVPIESMASGKPCISINEGGPKYSIMNKNTGFLVETYHEMAEKMKYLSENQNAVEQMGKEGRKRVLAKYTWNIFLNKIENAFKEAAK